MIRRFIVFSILFLSFCCYGAVLAGDKKNEALPLNQEQKEEQIARGEASLKMLHSIIELKKNLNQRIKEKPAEFSGGVSAGRCLIP